MPTIAYLAGQFPLRSETFVYREVRELRRRGWNVHCVTLHPSNDAPPGSQDLTRDLITVYDRWLGSAASEIVAHPVGSSASALRLMKDIVAPGEGIRLGQAIRLPAQGLAALSLSKHLRERNVRHVHCHFAHSPTTIGMYAARQLGVSFSFTGHANDLFQRRMLLRRKLQHASFVSCISHEHRRLYRSIVDRPDTAYPIIRAGVDVASFVDVARSSESSSHILTVCRLVEKKGVDMLLRALSGLPESVHLTIAGDGPQRSALEQLARELRVKHRVQFLGAVANDAVRELLTDADVFALPCRIDSQGDQDGIPVVLMEAMASGVPVLSGDLAAIRELIVDRQTGRLVDGSNVGQVVDALQELLSGSSEVRAMAAAGRARVVAEFSLQENVDRLEASLHRAMGA